MLCKVVLPLVRQSLRLTGCARYGFFFFNKEKEELRKQIAQLKDSLEQAEDHQDMLSTYKEIISIREQLDKDLRKDRVCIELLLDKAELLALQISKDDEEIDDDLVEEMCDESLLERISFHNIKLHSFPENYKGYLINKVLAFTIPLRLIERPDMTKDIEGELERFREVLSQLRSYELANFDELDIYVDRKQADLQHDFELVVHNEIKYRNFIEKGSYQEAITSLEDNIYLLTRCQQLVNECMRLFIFIVSEHADTDFATEMEAYKDRVLDKFAEALDCLGQLQLMLHGKADARQYFEKASEIFLQTNGKHSLQYVISRCNYISTFIEESPQECENMLLDLQEELHLSENDVFQVIIDTVLFIKRFSEGKLDDELFDRIEKQRELNRESSELPLRQELHYLENAVSYCLLQGKHLKACKLIEELLYQIEELSTMEQQDWYILVYEFLNRLPTLQEKEKLQYQLYECLHQFPDDGTSKLFNLKRWAVLSLWRFQLRKSYELGEEESLEYYNQFIDRFHGKKHISNQYYETIMEMTNLLIDSKLAYFAFKYLTKLIKLDQKIGFQHRYKEWLQNQYNELKLALFFKAPQTESEKKNTGNSVGEGLSKIENHQLDDLDRDPKSNL